MTTVATMVERVRREAYGGHRPQMNILNTTVIAGATSLELSMGLDSIAGTQLISIGNEIFYVRDVNRTAQTITVIPAMFGTTAAAHVAGDLVEVGPRWHRALIFDTMLEELQSWPTSIYRIGAVNLAYAQGTRGYDLAGVPATFTDVLAVLRSPDIVSGSVSNNSSARIPFRVERQLDPATFPSGAGLFIEIVHTAGVKMRVIYNRPFDLSAWTDATDLEATVGLSANHLDILKWGTLWRLSATGETSRTDPRDNHDLRDDQAIPGLLNTRNATALLAIRDRRIADEAARLVDQWKLAGW